jgi:hypothetical protein
MLVFGAFDVDKPHINPPDRLCCTAGAPWYIQFVVSKSLGSANICSQIAAQLSLHCGL